MAFQFNKRTSTGVFVPSGNGLKEFKGDVGNGSLDNITLALGYHNDQVYFTHTAGGPKDNIITICFEILTRNIVFVLTDIYTTYLSDKDIKRHLIGFSVTKEFNSDRITESLTNGMDHGSLTIEFMSKILKLKNVSRNGMFYSDRISTYLYFTDGLLTDFHLEDGLFPVSKALKKNNSTVYNYLADLAYKYWPNDQFQAIKEINIQCEAWSHLPGAFGNEYISLHRTENGGANLHMIRVCHYNFPITLSEFKEINHGRFTSNQNQETQDQVTLTSGKFQYTFDCRTEGLIEINSDIIA